VPYVFFAFRIMVGLWFLMLMLVVAGGWLMWRKRIDEAPFFHLACVCSSPLPFLAVLCGWIVTEVGRQPYVVYGRFRTADAVSPVAASAVAGSFALFILVYTSLLIAFFFYAIRTVLRGQSTKGRNNLRRYSPAWYPPRPVRPRSRRWTGSLSSSGPRSCSASSCTSWWMGLILASAS